jgi:menaquinone-dependent protoporphyrinogen oxidase
MKVLIAYCTTEGQTRKVVEAVADQIRTSGNEAVLDDVCNVQSDVRPREFDKVIVAGSVHDGRHQEDLNLFVFANRERLRDKPSLFISVSMAAAFEDTMADAERYANEFCDSSEWQPTARLLVAGALQHGKYGYYEEMLVRHKVLAKHAIDHPESDQEFTDWDALARSIAKFIEE